MFSKDFFDQMGQKISETIANSPAKDIEKNIKSMMVATFNKMDLVTREEFDIQQNVLLKTREQLAKLEQRVTVLEAANKSLEYKPQAETTQAEIPTQTESVSESEMESAGD